MKKIVVAITLMATPAFAEGFAVDLTDQDSFAIRQICDAARGSPSITLEGAGGITQYCLGLLGRIAAAQERKKHETPPK